MNIITTNVSQLIQKVVKRNGGCTLTVARKKDNTFQVCLFEPQIGYQVGIDEIERLSHGFNDRDVRQWCEYVEKASKRELEPCFIGLWYNKDDEQTYVDVSVFLTTQQVALSVAKQRKQIAIWDWEKKEEIPVEKEKKNFIVKLTVQAGEYEKSALHIITEESEEAAIEAAFKAEAHDPEGLEKTDNGVCDLGGEFYYKADKVEVISDEEARIIRKYL